MADRERAAVDWVDVARLAVGCVGAGLLGYGGWLHYPPIGFCIGGAILVVVALVGALRAR